MQDVPDPPWPCESDELPEPRSINSDLAKRLRASYYAKPQAERDEIEAAEERSAAWSCERVAAISAPDLEPDEPEPIVRRRKRRPNLGRLIKRAERETGKQVTSAVVDGVTLNFGQPEGIEKSDPWDRALGIKQ